MSTMSRYGAVYYEPDYLLTSKVNIHTDTLNESGYVEKTLEAIGGRTIHTYVDDTQP